MNINRITIGIYDGITNRRIIDKQYGKLFRYHEDIILHHLKKKTNFGGFGYFHTKLFNSHPGDNYVKTSGQILEVQLKSIPISMDSFSKLSELEQLNSLLNFATESLNLAAFHINQDGIEILKAIESARETGMSLKEEYNDLWDTYFKRK